MISSQTRRCSFRSRAAACPSKEASGRRPTSPPHSCSTESEQRFFRAWRIKAVPKSAFAASGTRPKPVDHYESIRAAKLVTDRRSLCLVDDVITKGATLLAAATRLQETYSEAKVTAFALVRALGFVDDIDQIVEPAIGTITLRGDEAFRVP